MQKIWMSHKDLIESTIRVRLHPRKQLARATAAASAKQRPVTIISLYVITQQINLTQILSRFSKIGKI